MAKPTLSFTSAFLISVKPLSVITRPSWFPASVVRPRSSMILRWYLTARSLKTTPWSLSCKAISRPPKGSRLRLENFQYRNYFPINIPTFESHSLSLTVIAYRLLTYITRGPGRLSIFIRGLSVIMMNRFYDTIYLMIRALSWTNRYRN